MEDKPSPPPNNFQYVVAVLIMSALGVAAVIAVTLMRPSQDNTVLIASIFGFLLPTTMALLAFMKSQETHLSVNSRLDAFLSEARLAAKAEGVAEGRETAEKRADQIMAQTKDKT